MCAHGLDDGVRLSVFEERRLAVRPEDHEPRKLRLHPARDIAGQPLMIDRFAGEWGGDWGKNAFEIHAKTLTRPRYQDAPIAMVPPIRMCSPALESSNSGRTNITWPAAMRTPAKPASVPAVASLRTISRLVHLKILLVSVQSAGESRVDVTRVTPRPPPAYACVRPAPKYLRMRARAAVTVESKRTSLSKLRCAFWVSPSTSMPQPCGDLNPTPPPMGTPTPR